MAPNNTLPIHGNEKTMNLNSLVLANIQASPYFKAYLYELKTYHQVVDEIYYKVTHLEPWEKGSRNTAGQTGMCGGVRGVGTGGIVSSSFCLLYKLFTLKLTRKQLIGLCTHTDSPYIRGLGLMYIRFTQPPADLWEWYEPYLDDEEEIDVKAGGGHPITIGEMCVQMLTRLEWYGTLFPRIPVPIEKSIQTNLAAHRANQARAGPSDVGRGRDAEETFGEAERRSRRDDDDRYEGRAPLPSRRRSPDVVRDDRDRQNGARGGSLSSRRSPLERNEDRRRQQSTRPSPTYHRYDPRDDARARGERQKSRSHDDRRRSRSRDERKGSRSRDERKRSRSRDERKRSRSRDERKGSRSRDERKRSRSRGERKRSRSRDERRRSKSRDERRRSRSREEKRKLERDERKRSRSPRNGRVDSNSKTERRRSRSRDRKDGSRSRDRKDGSRSRDEKLRSRSREKGHRGKRSSSRERRRKDDRRD